MNCIFKYDYSSILADLLPEGVRVLILPHMTVAQWLTSTYLTEVNALVYPNARTAYEIQNSPLGKALE